MEASSACACLHDDIIMYSYVLPFVFSIIGWAPVMECCSGQHNNYSPFVLLSTLYIAS